MDQVNWCTIRVGRIKCPFPFRLPYKFSPRNILTLENALSCLLSRGFELLVLFTSSPSHGLAIVANFTHLSCLSMLLRFLDPSLQADVDADVAAPGVPKKRTFKKFSFRGVDLDALLDMSTDELVKLFPARARRRFQRGLKRKPMALIKKLRKAKREAPPGEKPEPVRTHLRNMII
ncbi:hypothetical protein Gorai_002731, partial [Gossypium raimondii]|nr:hypothetical protein [Gossypium raimondii]